MTNIEHLSLPSVFIEPSKYDDKVIVYKKDSNGTKGTAHLVYCSESILSAIRILNKSEKKNKTDIELVEWYMNRFLKD